MPTGRVGASRRASSAARLGLGARRLPCAQPRPLCSIEAGSGVEIGPRKRPGLSKPARLEHGRSPTRELGHVDFTDCGRLVEAEVAADEGQRGDGSTVTLVSAYVHTGEAQTPRQDERYAFLKAMSARMKELEAGGRLAVVTGDLNVAHRQGDLKNWKGNLGRAGFLPQEQAYLDGWLDHGGWVGVTRRAAGDVAGPYTWWSWRGKAFDNDAGWRIDYQLATTALADTVASTHVGRATTSAQRWSDHAPVVADYRPERQRRV